MRYLNSFDRRIKRIRNRRCRFLFASRGTLDFGAQHPDRCSPTDYLFHLPCPACNYPRRPHHRSVALDHRSTSCPAFYRRRRCRWAPLLGIPVWCSPPHHLKHDRAFSVTTVRQCFSLFKTNSKQPANFAPLLWPFVRVQRGRTSTGAPV